MHAIRFDRRPLVAALGALAMTGATVAAADALGEIELGGGSGGAGPATPARSEPPAPPLPSTQPVWVTEPLAAPALLR